MCACVHANVRVWVPGSAWACACMCVHIGLLIQHAKRMRHIVISVASLAPPHFSTLYHKKLDFRKNVTEHKMCILIFYITFV